MPETTTISGKADIITLACLAPTTITTSNETLDGFTISWSAVNESAGYSVLVVSEGLDPDTTTPSAQYPQI